MEEEMSTTEAAAYLGVTVQRIHQLGVAGLIQRRRVGFFWVYSKKSLDEWKQSPKSRGGRPKKEE
jgi:hypothetical protein